MRERGKRPLYYCRRLTPADAGYQEGMETFTAPVLRYLNFRSLDGETSLLSGGEVNSKNLIAKVPAEADRYFEKDRCYIYTEPPTNPDPLCKGADYAVATVLPNHRTVEVILERRSS